MKWHAWDVEYPDEGSIIVEADTYERAREKAGVQLDIDNEFVGLSPDTDTERARIRRETWEEAARWLTAKAEEVGPLTEQPGPFAGDRLWARAGTRGALEYAAAEFRRRAEEEGNAPDSPEGSTP